MSSYLHEFADRGGRYSVGSVALSPLKGLPTLSLRPIINLLLEDSATARLSARGRDSAASGGPEATVRDGVSGSLRPTFLAAVVEVDPGLGMSTGAEICITFRN